ncbi:isoleucine--tRNA ligase [Candidatus Uhrbacteria bacterium]|nr:isoleucine--tRNA ligase [Candidatus Uhrbacteria bacterium]
MSDISKREEKLIAFWEKNRIFEKSVDQRPEEKPYVFYDGPPFATGLPHYGHILSSVIKDVVPRYWTMKGYRVRRRWGWDCHGLPIENLIEKQLKISGKKEINTYGIEQFNNACRSAVLTYTQEWKKMVRRIGRWVEFDTAYRTMDTSYMESVWWALKTIWDKGLIYEGRKVLLYCPRCETPISKAEVAMDNSYQDVTEEAVTVKFKLANAHKKLGIVGDVYLLAWTTTPWTLPGNVALAVGSDIDYSLLETEGGQILAAKERIATVLDKKAYTMVKEYKGSEIVGCEYEPLFDMPAVRETGKKAYYVAAADFVTTDEGTGVVHTAVVYGEDDYNLGLALDLPVVPMLNERGEYTDVVPEFLRGRAIKQAEKDIKKNLTERGLMFACNQHTHSYPRCWRCETFLIYNAISAWFINIQKIKSRLIELNEKISWYPNHLKHGRFLHILETAPDWNISRNRYWATPLPFWRCTNSDTDCKETVCIGSVRELRNKALNFDEVYGSDALDAIDLHKHTADRVLVKCDACGGTMERIPEVIDCWVESASMPFAEFHYPFENENVFKSRFPGQYIAEYIAQTRAWFYYMHVMAVVLFDNISFEHCVTTGTILNEKGEKLSKSKMNYTDPWVVIEQYGVDALRYYLLTSVVMDAENLFFNDREVRDAYNKVVNILRNVFEFYTTYAPDAGEQDDVSKNPLDAWILSRLHSLVRDVTLHMDTYATVKAGRLMKAFIDELSTWYLRRSRDRFKSDDMRDRQQACATMREVLVTLCKIIAPFTPFIAEELYQGITRKESKNPKCESVHLESWPTVHEALINTSLEEDMALVRQIVEMAHSLRAESGIRVRQPLMTLQHTGKISDELNELIAEEVNVKMVQNVSMTNGEAYCIEKQYGDLRVALNTTLTPELKEEGIVRELVRHINALRKEQGLTPKDIIALQWDTDSTDLIHIIEIHNEEIAASVIAGTLLRGATGGMQAVPLGGREIRFKLDVISVP